MLLKRTAPVGEIVCFGVPRLQPCTSAKFMRTLRRRKRLTEIRHQISQEDFGETAAQLPGGAVPDGAHDGLCGLTRTALADPGCKQLRCLASRRNFGEMPTQKNPASDPSWHVQPAELFHGACAAASYIERAPRPQVRLPSKPTDPAAKTA